MRGWFDRSHFVGPAWCSFGYTPVWTLSKHKVGWAWKVKIGQVEMCLRRAPRRR